MLFVPAAFVSSALPFSMLRVDASDTTISELVIDGAEETTIGSPLTVSAKITIAGVPNQPFIAVFEVRDSQGVTIFLDLRNGMLDNGQATVASRAWVPESPGPFTARTFAISDFVEPEILTGVQSESFEVTADPDGLAPPDGTEDLVDIGDLSLMLPILNTQDPQQDLDIIKGHLKSGDILVDGLTIQHMLVSTKSSIPGLEVAIGGTSTENVPIIIERSAPGIDYITYDYERDFTPEWSTDQDESIKHFSQLSELAHADGKKFIVVPVYAFGQDWDWGEVAASSGIDILVLQVQNFQTGARVPPEYMPVALGEDMTQAVNKVVGQVAERSPETKVYLQMDTLVTEDPEDVLKDILLVKDLGIDGLTLWYNPGVSASSSKITILEEVLSGLKRS